jgi:hypothetical protein
MALAVMVVLVSHLRFLGHLLLVAAAAAAVDTLPMAAATGVMAVLVVVVMVDFIAEWNFLPLEQ